MVRQSDIRGAVRFLKQYAGGAPVDLACKCEFGDHADVSRFCDIG
jgi:hypothetical protein